LTYAAALAAAAAMLASTAGAEAPDPTPAGQEPIATLYDLPGFQGRRIDIYASGSNLAASNFNDLAKSGRFQGGWRLCEDSNFRGRCQDVQGDIADFGQVGMGLKISSLQAYVEDWGLEGGWSGGPGSRMLEGDKTSLFPHPRLAGHDIAAAGQAANAYCRSQGLGSAAYYDSSERARQAVDLDGRYVGEVNVLRDVLCRR
jgi:hypothetical protein